MIPIDLDRVLQQWPPPRPQAVALLGSYARGDAGPFSDVDFLFLLPAGAQKPKHTNFLLDERLVTVNAVTPEQMDGWFTEPEQAVNVVAALREAIPLQDEDRLFAQVQSRARSFAWTAEMQAKADRYASHQMVGWIEETHKGLEGLRRNDVGRLLNARFGLSWGLAGLMRVQRGILGNSDNSFYDDVRRGLGEESRWSRLLAAAFGVTESDGNLISLHESVIAGLQLYCETAHLLVYALQPDDRPLIDATVARIETTICHEGRS